MTDLEVWYSAYLAALAGGQPCDRAIRTAYTALATYVSLREQFETAEEGD